MSFEIIFNYRNNGRLVYSTTTPGLVRILRDGVARASPGSEILFTADGQLFALLKICADLVVVECESSNDDGSGLRTQREHIMQYLGDTVMLDDAQYHVEVVRVF